jgi:hypothetical protein
MDRRGHAVIDRQISDGTPEETAIETVPLGYPAQLLH